MKCFKPIYQSIWTLSIGDKSIMHGILHSGPISPQSNQVTGAQLSHSARMMVSSWAE